jgi:aminopeptidase N
MPTETPQPIYIKDYKPPAWLIEEVSLDVRLEPETTRVASRLLVRPNPRRAGDTVHLELDGERLTLQEVGIDGSKLNPDQYAVNPEKLIISGVPQRPFTLDLVTLCNPKQNTELSGLYMSKGIYCTQC